MEARKTIVLKEPGMSGFLEALDTVRRDFLQPTRLRAHGATITRLLQDTDIRYISLDTVNYGVASIMGLNVEYDATIAEGTVVFVQEL